MELYFTFIGGDCWTIEIDNKFKIACDPALTPKGTKYDYRGSKVKRVEEPIYNSETFKNVKIWLLTSNRFDRIDELGINLMEEDSKIIARKECGKLLREKKNANLYFLDWYKKRELEIKGYYISIEAIPSYKEGGFMSRASSNEINGYFIIIRKNEDIRRIYFTGDTIYHEKIVKELIMYKIDVIIANIGQVKCGAWSGTKTMDIVMLNSFINNLTPGKVLPIHLEDFSNNTISKKDIEKYINPVIKGERIKI